MQKFIPGSWHSEANTNFSQLLPPTFFLRDAQVVMTTDVLLMKSRSLLSNQIMELKLQHEQERTHLLQQHNTEKDSLVQDHQREIASLEKQARSAMAQHQAQTQEWRKRDAQVCGLCFFPYQHVLHVWFAINYAIFLLTFASFFFCFVS